MSDEGKAVYWGRQMDEMMAAIRHEAAICHVNLLAPGVLDAIVKNNDSVCAIENPRAFKKLRDLLMMSFIVQEKSIERLGPMASQALVEAIREQLQQHPGFHA
jgi:hypothetical protein